MASGRPANLPLRDRINDLERELRDLQRQLAAQKGRSAVVARPRDVRLGKIASASADTFSVIHQELSFTKTAGSQSPTYTDRSASAQTVAKHPVNIHIPNDAKVLVVTQANGHDLVIPLYQDVICRVVGSTITGRAAGSNTCPVGLAQLYYINGSSVLTNTGVTVTITNPTPQRLIANNWLRVRLEPGGRLVVQQNLGPVASGDAQLEDGGTQTISAAGPTLLNLTSATPWGDSTFLQADGTNKRLTAFRTGVYRFDWSLNLEISGTAGAGGTYELVDAGLYISGTLTSTRSAYGLFFGTGSTTMRASIHGSVIRALSTSQYADVQVFRSNNPGIQVDVLEAFLLGRPAGIGDGVSSWG